MTFSMYNDAIDGIPGAYNDGAPIILGNTFYVTTGTIDVNNAYVIGGRVYTEPVAAQLLDIMLYEVPDGQDINPLVGRTPVRTVRVTSNPDGWTEGIFDTPWKVPGLTRPWMIAYRFVADPAVYLANLNFRPDNIPWSVYPDSGLFLSAWDSSAGGNTWKHGYFALDNGDAGNSNKFETGYCTDTIVNVAPAGPVYSVWNGSVEVPATAKLWNGSTEVSITTEVAT